MQLGISIIFFLILITATGCSDFFKGPHHDERPRAEIPSSKKQIIQFDPAKTKAAMDVMQSRCSNCHNASTSLGGVGVLNDPDKLLQSDLVVAGDPSRSRLFQEISTGRMPPAGMSQTEAEAVRVWISEGIKSINPDSTPPVLSTEISVQVLGPSSLAIHWQAATDEDSGIEEYRVFRDGIRIVSLPPEALSYSDFGLSADTNFSYQLEAADNAGNVSRSAAVSGRTAVRPTEADTTAPSLPGNLRGSAASASRIDLQWNASNDNSGGVGLRGYLVYRNGSFFKEVAPQLTSWSDNESSPATNYRYLVSAIDLSGNESAKSNELSVTTPAINGPALYASKCQDCHGTIETSDKRNRSAAAIRDAIVSVSQMRSLSSLSVDEVAAIASSLVDLPDTTAPSKPGSVGVTLSNWNTALISWAVSTDTGGSGMKQYQVFRNGTQIATVTHPGTSYSNGGLAASTNYTYQVAAVDSAGNVSSLSTGVIITSGTAPPTPDTTAPTVPAGLQSQGLSYNQVSISWAASTDSGGSGLASYRVVRNGVVLRTVASNVTSIQDTGLTSKTSYSYQVAAIDGAGNVSALSAAYSITTLQPDGVVLYSNRCASCHDSLSSSNLKKRFSNSSDFLSRFKTAVGGTSAGVSQMSSIVLTDDEVNAISALLIGTSVPPKKAESTYIYSNPLATRSYVSSMLTQVFVNTTNPTAQDNNMIATIKSSVGDNVSGFGGPCNRYDGTTACPISEGARETAVMAPVRPSAGASRSSWGIVACSQVMYFDNSIINALSKVGLNTDSEATSANVLKVYQLFNMAEVPSLELDAELRKTHADALAAGMSRLGAWRMLMLPLCEYSAQGAF